ncbi:hypothetical protein [Vibrio intestinalis]|uniref:hypothetical protein n=1 Tax=Vibrio intestinalis TaxID=2933291 RepID=UPI0021A51945|nr:hypothetical protein [Vibrio intestinalis]
MKKVLIIALSLVSVSAFAGNSAQSNNGLNGDLIQKATAEGMTTDQAVHGVATGDFEFHSVLDRKENRRRASY